jgi:hypothetical protein
MSWTTKEGSSSGLGRLPPRFRLSERVRRGVAPGRHDTRAAGRGCFADDRGASAAPAAGSEAARSAARPLGQLLYRFEGFG